MPTQSTDITYRLSGGATNADPKASLGGAKSATAAGGDLWDKVSGAESAAGAVEYRCIYVHAAAALPNARAYLTANPGSRLAIGLGTSALNGTEAAPASTGEGTAPAGVSFSAPADYASGIALGDLAAGGHRAVWLRRTIPSGATEASGSGNVRVTGDNT